MASNDTNKSTSPKDARIQTINSAPIYKNDFYGKYNLAYTLKLNKKEENTHRDKKKEEKHLLISILIPTFASLLQRNFATKLL